MAIQTKIGQTARGEDFFLRPKVIEGLYNEIRKNSNILLSAPRRIGKTSLMFYLLDNKIDKHIFKYLITESVNNENDFYKKLYKTVLEIVGGITFLRLQALQLIKSNKITSISFDGTIQIVNADVNYYNELLFLLKSLNLKDHKLIIMIDEFSETLSNIIIDEGERQAIHFLESNRDFRHIPELQGKVQFIYTGSIGLENIVIKLNKINTINDLYLFKVKPFTKNETFEFVNKLILNSDLVINDEQKEYLISVIEWLVPYYIQIMIDELDKIDIEWNKDGKRVVTNDLIDEALNNALDNRIYFEHWLSRLRISYKKDQYKFVIRLLNKASKNKHVNIKEILDLSIEYSIEDEYKEILGTLIYDGYVNNSINNDEYRFNSPLLREYWKIKIAI